MNAPVHTSLAQLGAVVRAAVGGATVFQTLNTRLIIQLGVDLRAPTEAQNLDPGLVRRVEDALKRMGIELGGSPG
jgi:hypothetical protein